MTLLIPNLDFSGYWKPRHLARLGPRDRKKLNHGFSDEDLQTVDLFAEAHWPMLEDYSLVSSVPFRVILSASHPGVSGVVRALAVRLLCSL